MNWHLWYAVTLVGIGVGVAVVLFTLFYLTGDRLWLLPAGFGLLITTICAIVSGGVGLVLKVCQDRSES